MTDARLVEAARSGDRQAFGELVTRYQGQVYALAFSLLGDWAEAQDMAQESFLRAHRNLDLLADPAKFGPWLRKVVFGTCMDRARALRAESYGTARDAPPRRRSSDLKTRIADGAGSGPLDRLLRAELKELVLKAVNSLPERQRVPLTLFHLDGLSHEKVARFLGLPVGTVRSLVSRARTALRPLLASYARELDFVVEDVFEECVNRTQPGGAAKAMLHVHNGDSAAESLRRSGVPGDICVWAEVLHEGPIPAGASPEDWRRTRARFYAECGWEPFDTALDRLRRWDSGLESYPEYEEVILWFEHDLFDQLLLIRHLDWFSRRDLSRTKLNLICIGEYPGIARFCGLGQLTPDQLGSLLDTRQRVVPAQVELARVAWQAFSSPDPTEIESVLAGDTSALPFLAGALVRHLEQFPSVRNGLNRTQNQALSAVAAGHTTPAEIFVAVGSMEERPFMGDSTFWLYLEGLASGLDPLLTIESSGASTQPFPERFVALTGTGHRVLAAELDHVRRAGIDRWHGGVHLRGLEAAWRWDETRHRLVPASA